MIKEFSAFLRQYGVIGLAIAVIIGGKLNELVTALVSGLLMPLVSAATSATGKDWREMKWPSEGALQFEVGKVLGAGIDFIIVAFIVFWIAKKLLKEESVTRK